MSHASVADIVQRSQGQLSQSLVSRLVTMQTGNNISLPPQQQQTMRSLVHGHQATSQRGLHSGNITTQSIGSRMQQPQQMIRTYRNQSGASPQRLIGSTTLQTTQQRVIRVQGNQAAGISNAENEESTRRLSELLQLQSEQESGEE